MADTLMAFRQSPVTHCGKQPASDTASPEGRQNSDGVEIEFPGTGLVPDIGNFRPDIFSDYVKSVAAQLLQPGPVVAYDSSRQSAIHLSHKCIAPAVL